MASKTIAEWASILEGSKTENNITIVITVVQYALGKTKKKKGKQ